jgi:hypothetical protein
MYRNTRLLISAITLIGMSAVSAFYVINNVWAGCRWVWKGTDSYYVCDEAQNRRNDISICDFSSIGEGKDAPKTVTVLCRPDGSPWKEVIVGPKRVMVTVLRHDGSISESKRIDITRAGAATVNTTKERRPPKEPAQWKIRDWQTKVLGIKIKGQVQRRENDIKGFLKFPLPFSRKAKVYRFEGHVNGRNITANSGKHTFRGTIRKDGKVKGKVHIHHGPSIPFVSPIALP